MKLLPRFLSSIDYLLRRAEDLQIREKLVLVIQSEMGRTPTYNKGDGKDHWSIIVLDAPHPTTISLHTVCMWGYARVYMCVVCVVCVVCVRACACVCGCRSVRAWMCVCARECMCVCVDMCVWSSVLIRASNSPRVCSASRKASALTSAPCIVCECDCESEYVCVCVCVCE